MPLIACTVFVLLLLWAEFRQATQLRRAAKLAASATFVWAAVSWGGWQSSYGQLMLLGLGLCALGDALLLPEGRGRWFQLGIAAFGLGHLAYAMAFIVYGISTAATGVAAALMLAVGWIVLRWLGPQVPSDLKIPVIVYGIIISAMVAFAIGAVADQGPSGSDWGPSASQPPICRSPEIALSGSSSSMPHGGCPPTISRNSLWPFPSAKQDCRHRVDATERVDPRPVVTVLLILEGSNIRNLFGGVWGSVRA